MKKYEEWYDLAKEGVPPTMEVLLSENNDYHEMFMKLKAEGDLEGQHLEFQLYLRSGIRKPSTPASVGASSSTARVSTLPAWPC